MVERLVADGAIILAGGPSSRMGEAKALVEVAGKPMLQLVMEALGQSGIEKAILSMKSEEQASEILGKLPCEETTAGLRRVGVDGVPFQIIVDEEVNREGNSAVRGMSGAVSLARNQGWDSIQMVPCDLPFLDPRLPALLYSKLTAGQNCAVARSYTGLEPLLFCAKTEALDTALDDMGDAAHQVIAKMGAVEVGPDEWVAAGISERCFTNVNTKEDLDSIN